MKCIVTGGAGFIGSNLVDKLIQDGHEVTVIDNESSDAHDNFYWNEKANNYKYNVCDYIMCSDVFKRHKPDIVFHLAAEARIQPCIDDPLKAVESNVVGTTTILELCRKYKVKRLVFSSTSSAYGLKNNTPSNENMLADCLNPYSATKVAGEEMCKMYSKLYGLETVILRYFNVYGERQPVKGQYAPVIGIFKRQKDLNQSLTIVGDGEQRRDFVHVSDVIYANILAATKIFDEWQIDGTKQTIYQFGQIYNVGTGINYSIKDIAKMISKDYKHIESRVGEARITLADISKIQKQLDWKPKIKLNEWIAINS